MIPRGRKRPVIMSRVSVRCSFWVTRIATNAQVNSWACGISATRNTTLHVDNASGRYLLIDQPTDSGYTTGSVTADCISGTGRVMGNSTRRRHSCPPASLLWVDCNFSSTFVSEQPSITGENFRDATIARSTFSSPSEGMSVEPVIITSLNTHTWPHITPQGKWN